MPRAAEFSESELAALLLNVLIFESLSQRQLKKLSRWVKVLAFEDGETVVKRGDEGGALYVILEGTAEVRRGGRTLARLTIGQFFGEMSLFDNQLRSADVLAVRPVKVGILSQSDFWKFADSQPAVLRSVLHEMARRLRQTDRNLPE